MADRDKASDTSRRDFPAAVRRAAHDLAQPFQALRMMLELPGVVADDGRGLPGKLARALAEMERRLTLLQRLARRLDGEAEPSGQPHLAEIVDIARADRPDLWDGRVRCRNGGCVLPVPPHEAALVLNALVENAGNAHARRIVVGARAGGRRIVVADDGDGLDAAARDALVAALAGDGAEVLGGGLFLARLLVAGWGGGWKLASRPAGGACVEVLLQG